MRSEAELSLMDRGYWSESAIDLAGVVEAALRSSTEIAGQAHDLSFDFVLEIGKRLGGMMVYLPTALPVDDQAECRASADHHIWPRHEADFRAALEAVLADATPRSEQVAIQVVAAIGKNYIGRAFYVPNNHRRISAMRDEAIGKRIGPERATDLAAEFGIGNIAVYACASRYQERLKIARERRRNGHGEAA